MNIRIQYVLMVSEYLEGFDSVNRRQTMFIIDNLVSGIIFILGLFYIFYLKEVVWTVIGIVFCVLGIITISKPLRPVRLMIRSQFLKSNKARSEQKITFSNDGLDYEIENARSRIDWKYYEYFLEAPRTLVLIHEKRQYSVIPKRAFTDGDLSEIVAYLKDRYKDSPSPSWLRRSTSESAPKIIS